MVWDRWNAAWPDRAEFLMRTLLIACGNPLRCDDGAAHEVLRLITPAPDLEARDVQQLTPEIAQEMNGFARVVFLDADARCAHPVIETVRDSTSRSALTHASDPAEILALSRALFAFHGEAFLCRIPARNFSPGEAMPPDQRRVIEESVRELERFLS
jgi:hydrogenase maturation protease